MTKSMRERQPEDNPLEGIWGDEARNRALTWSILSRLASNDLKITSADGEFSRGGLYLVVMKISFRGTPQSLIARPTSASQGGFDKPRIGPRDMKKGDSPSSLRYA